MGFSISYICVHLAICLNRWEEKMFNIPDVITLFVIWVLKVLYILTVFFTNFLFKKFSKQQEECKNSAMSSIIFKSWFFLKGKENLTARSM